MPFAVEGGPDAITPHQPPCPESFWTFRWAVDGSFPTSAPSILPLGLATLAALSPESWEVEIVDENVESIPRDPRADIIGVCGMGVQFPRQQRAARRTTASRGYYVVAGGSYASLCPEQYDDLADTVMAGEAEYIWPRFCRDFEAGNPQAALPRDRRGVACTTPRCRASTC